MEPPFFVDKRILHFHRDFKIAKLLDHLPLTRRTGGQNINGLRLLGLLCTAGGAVHDQAPRIFRIADAPDQGTRPGPGRGSESYIFSVISVIHPVDPGAEADAPGNLVGYLQAVAHIDRSRF